MDENQRSIISVPKPEGRFNKWGERKILTAPEEKQRAVTQELLEFRGEFRSKSLFWAARLTDSTGIEFVFISNTQFLPIYSERNHIYLVPCFTPLNPLNPQTEDKQAAMMKRGEFIYDGWIPNIDMSSVSLEKAVSQLDDLVSLFSIVGRFYAYWEPKYFLTTNPVPSQLAHQDDFNALAYSIHITDHLPQPDKIAVSRSLAWLSNSFRNQPIQRLLLLFLSIESLATYIESDKISTESVLGKVFGGQKLTEKLRSKNRDECIKNIFSDGIFTAARIQQAYYDCINKSIKEKLKDHLDRVFQNTEASDLIFSEEDNKKSLWRLRNDIAHGSLNLLNEADNFYIARRVGELEAVARNYQRKIFTTLAKADYFPKPRRPILTIPFSQAVGSQQTQFVSTDMAEYYTNAEALSNSFLRATFE